MAREIPRNCLVTGVVDAVEMIKRASHNGDLMDYRVIDISSTR